MPPAFSAGSASRARLRPGGVGMAAAAIVGPSGAVVLSDIAPEMTAIAAERAKGSGLTNVTTREVDLERIDYPEASFDAVLCREGLMLVPDPATAVRECPGFCGQAAAPSSRSGDLANESLVGPAVRRGHGRTGLPVPPPGFPGRFA